MTQLTWQARDTWLGIGWGAALVAAVVLGSVAI
jgi:hypothetical protein